MPTRKLALGHPRSSCTSCLSDLALSKLKIELIWSAKAPQDCSVENSRGCYPTISFGEIFDTIFLLGVRNLANPLVYHINNEGLNARSLGLLSVCPVGYWPDIWYSLTIFVFLCYVLCICRASNY